MDSGQFTTPRLEMLIQPSCSPYEEYPIFMKICFISMGTALMNRFFCSPTFEAISAAMFCFVALSAS